MNSIYQFKSYKDFLRSLLKKERGATARMAEAAGCQSSYLSTVLQTGSKVQLTHDHIFSISEYLNLSNNESHFFQLLLEKERASLRKYRLKLEADIEAARSEYLQINKILNKTAAETKSLTDDVYYSHWIFSALHIAVSIPNLQTLTALSEHFFMPKGILRAYLEKLESLQLVQKAGPEKWVWKSGDLHLPDKSPLAGMHQSTWRGKAVENKAFQSQKSIHYTVVQSISRDDFERLRLIVLDWISLFQKISSPSKPEELVNLNVDFYRVVNLTE